MSTALPVRVPIDVASQLERVTDYWSPKVIARVNDQYVKIVRLLGELTAGLCCVGPRGVEHHPVAAEETWIVLVETVTTRHTGDRATPQTRSIEEQLA